MPPPGCFATDRIMSPGDTTTRVQLCMLFALQATFSLVLNRPQSFSLLEDLGKLFAQCVT